jgi:hypothetical protein
VRVNAKYRYSFHSVRLICVFRNPDFSFKPLQAFPERFDHRLVRGITLRQRGHGVADRAHIFMGRGKLLHHLFHVYLELGEAFLRLGHGL